MDIEKLYKDLTNREDLKDVPIEYITRVSVALLELLQGNKYIYEIGE